LNSYFQSMVKVFGIGAAFATLPFFASLAQLQPPWPPAIGYVSSALILLGTLGIWEFSRNSQVSRRKAYFIVSALICVASIFVYFMIYSLYVDSLPFSEARVVRGFECTATARTVYGSACPNLPTEALLDVEGDSLKLWTRSSVTIVRMGLTSTWLLFSVGLTMAIGAMVAGRTFDDSPPP
jgi:hypothetical protein